MVKKWEGKLDKFQIDIGKEGKRKRKGRNVRRKKGERKDRFRYLGIQETWEAKKFSFFLVIFFWGGAFQIGHVKFFKL